MEWIDLINSVFGSWAGIVLAVIGLFSAVAVILPPPTEKSGAVYRLTHKVLSWLACNVGQAKNATGSTSPVAKDK